MRNFITVQNSRLPLVEYKGQRVVTFEMVDNVHQRPAGTARASFNRNRQHFIEGIDYIRVSPDDYRAITHSVYVKHTRKKSAKMVTEFVTLLFESGYLMLVKSFRDGLAWQLQRLLVNVYFRAVPEFPELHHVAVPDVAQLETMPLQEAQHAVTRAEQVSFREHGQRGSQAMTLRRKEKKKIKPVLAQVRAWSQPQLTGLDTACGGNDQ